MLVLSRRKDQTIRIGKDIRITIIEIGHGSARIGIDAPRDVDIARTELDDRAEAKARVDAVVAARLEALANTGKPSPE